MSRTYVGSRQQGGKWVDVVDGGSKRPLANRGEHRREGFGWGTQTAGSVTLARSILWDVTGADSEVGMAITFAGDVVARLPDDAFALPELEVRDWLDSQDQRRMSGRELVEHLGSIALAEPEQEHAALRGLVDRCWSPRSLTN